MQKFKFIIAVDFDDTISKLREDLIPGVLIKNADKVINYLHDKGCYIIIWTCRDGKDQIDSMIKFLKDHKIKYDAINKNAPWVTFTKSPKIFSHLYVDDRGLCEIDWTKIKELAKEKIIQEKAKHIASEILKNVKI